MTIFTETEDLKNRHQVCQKTPGPVLIIHGTGDQIVDYHYAERAANAYPNAELKLIEKGSHGFSRKDDRTALGYVEKFIS